MNKISIKNHAVVAPTPLVIATAFDKEGRAQACTLAFFMNSSHNPPCITIAINGSAKRKTLQGILHSKAFAIGYPSCDQVKESDYFGIKSGHDTNKIEDVSFNVEKGKVLNIPIIKEFKLSLECELVHTVTVGSHTQLTGEIKNILADEDILDSKEIIILDKLGPIIYDEEELVYRRLGDRVGKAFSDGEEIS